LVVALLLVTFSSTYGRNGMKTVVLLGICLNSWSTWRVVPRHSQLYLRYGLAGPCTVGGGGTAGEIEDGCFFFFFRITKYPVKTPTPARASARMIQ